MSGGAPPKKKVEWTEEGQPIDRRTSPRHLVRKRHLTEMVRAVRTRYRREKLSGAQMSYLRSVHHMDLTKPGTLWGWKEIEPPVPVTKHLTYMAVAEKGGGKSCCVEHIAELYLNGPMHPVILDGIDGGSAEGCFWAIAPAYCPQCGGRVRPMATQCTNMGPKGFCGAELKPNPQPKYPILLVKPSNLTIHIPSLFDVAVQDDSVPLVDLLEQAKKEKRVLVFGWSLYRGRDRPRALQTLATWCLTMGESTMQADVDVVFLFREAGTYLFSKERVYHRTDPDLRQQAIQLVREARHQTRTVALLDSQREMDVTAALRSRTDRIFLGRQPVSQISKEMQWFLNDLWYNKRRRITNALFRDLAFPEVGWLDPGQFYVIYRAEQQYFKADMPFPSFNHRWEGEYLLDYGWRWHWPRDEAQPSDLAERIRREVEERQAAQNAQLVRNADREGALRILARMMRPPEERERGGVRLLDREREAVRSAIADGIPHRDIIRVLGVSPGTVAALAHGMRPIAGSSRSQTRESQVEPEREGEPEEEQGEEEEGET